MHRRHNSIGKKVGRNCVRIQESQGHATPRHTTPHHATPPYCGTENMGPHAVGQGCQCGVAWRGVECHGVAWCGVAWHGMVQCHMLCDRDPPAAPCHTTPRCTQLPQTPTSCRTGRPWLEELGAVGQAQPQTGSVILAIYGTAAPINGLGGRCHKVPAIACPLFFGGCNPRM